MGKENPFPMLASSSGNLGHQGIGLASQKVPFLILIYRGVTGISGCGTFFKSLFKAILWVSKIIVGAYLLVSRREIRVSSLSLSKCAGWSGWVWLRWSTCSCKFLLVMFISVELQTQICTKRSWIKYLIFEPKRPKEMIGNLKEFHGKL